MGNLHLRNFRQWPTDKISGRVLLVLIVVSAVVFGAFYMVGYDMPFIEDASFNAPLLTDVLLAYLYLLLAATIVVCVVSVVRGLRRRDKSENVTNGVPAGRIAYGSLALLVVSLLLTFAFGSSEPIKVNGVEYTDGFWLKATDMFINTAILLMVVAIGAVAYGLSGHNRRQKMKKGGD